MTIIQAMIDDFDKALFHVDWGCMARDLGEVRVCCWSDRATRDLFFELSVPTRTPADHWADGPHRAALERWNTNS